VHSCFDGGRGVPALRLLSSALLEHLKAGLRLELVTKHHSRLVLADAFVWISVTVCTDNCKLCGTSPEDDVKSVRHTSLRLSRLPAGIRVALRDCALFASNTSSCTGICFDHVLCCSCTRTCIRQRRSSPSPDIAAMPTHPSAVPLDPGEARPRAHRGRAGGLSGSLRRTCYMLVLVYNAYRIRWPWTAYQFYQDLGGNVLEPPLRELYYAGDTAGADLGDYMKPLIDDQQTFDIAFSVWQQVPGGERTGYIAAHTPSGREIRTDEELVHSSVVFEGVKMTDKYVRSTVSFRVPTAPLSVAVAPPAAARADLFCSASRLLAIVRLGRLPFGLPS
jgi:hypothetical protein